MPVPENTEKGSAVKDVMPSTNQGEEETVSIAILAADQKEDVVVETKDAKPAKKRKYKVRHRQSVTSRPDRSTDAAPDAANDDVLEDKEICAKKLEPANVDEGKTEAPNEKGDSSDVSAQVLEGSTNLTQLPKPLPTLAYDEVTRLSRTMHYADFRKCFKAKKFLTSKIKSQYKTLLPKDGDFLWFRAQNDGANDDAQDWFGNVRCSFDLLKFLKENESVNLFYVDCAYFGYSSASRILLTTKTHFKNATKIDLRSLKYGDPLMFDGEKLFFLRRDVSRNKKWVGNHQTEVVIDASTIDTGRLFKICDKTAVNHSKANRKGKHNRFVCHQCLIFNSTNKNCPSAWTAEVTAKCLKDFMGIENSGSVPTI